jgi:hypothetical protein
MSTLQVTAPRASKPRDELVPDTVVCQEFGITAMTLWRWDRDRELGFPPAVKIRSRKFRSRRLLEDWKERMVAEAIQQRRPRSRPRRRGQTMEAA